MIKRTFVAMFLLGVFTVGVAGDKIEPKKFEVVFTVKYNAISLEDAARKEKVFRELYKDACKVDVNLSPAANSITFSSGTTELYWEPATVETPEIDINITTLEFKYTELDSSNQ